MRLRFTSFYRFCFNWYVASLVFSITAGPLIYLGKGKRIGSFLDLIWLSFLVFFVVIIFHLYYLRKSESKIFKYSTFSVIEVNIPLKNIINIINNNFNVLETFNNDTNVTYIIDLENLDINIVRGFIKCYERDKIVTLEFGLFGGISHLRLATAMPFQNNLYKLLEREGLEVSEVKKSVINITDI